MTDDGVIRVPALRIQGLCYYPDMTTSRGTNLPYHDRARIIVIGTRIIVAVLSRCRLVSLQETDQPCTGAETALPCILRAEER